MTISPERLKLLRKQQSDLEDSEENPAMTPTGQERIREVYHLHLEEQADALLTIAEREQALIEVLRTLCGHVQGITQKPTSEFFNPISAPAPELGKAIYKALQNGLAALALCGEYPQ
jgi:hypothetical protein